MAFNPGIEIGDELSNDEMRKLFRCGNMGGMRRSKHTGTLVIISDNTKELYRDEWKKGVLHYTGMGKIGDQVLKGNQNGTLYYSETNDVEVHLFEVLKKTIYTYYGVVKLVEEPYIDRQLDDEGNMRNVWIFPVRPVVDIEKAIAEHLEREIVKLSNKELIKKSKENLENKEPKIVETTVYYRDPFLREIVKRIANGQCQYCGMKAPFKDKNNEPYLEEHHVERLADGGTDTIDNVVAICPNCHKKIHVLNDNSDIIVLRNVAKQNQETLARLLSYEKEINRSNQHEDNKSSCCNHRKG